MTDRMPTRLLAVAIGGLLATLLAGVAAAQADGPGPAFRDQVVVEHSHRGDHDTMMGWMRAGDHPAMTEQMRSDRMWQMMHEDRYIERMERERARIDQMLGR